eukprot:GSChrysophyteH1.ASY1.ANO1.3009.1 assembled CDS
MSTSNDVNNASSSATTDDPDFGSDYKCLKVVGKGGSSTVYKGVLTKTERFVAIKQIDTDGLSKDEILSIRQEIDTIKDLSHEHIVSYLGTRKLPSKIMIFLEYADRGSLSYLHENGIAHRDVKCANCLLTKGGVIKLGDFGASKRFESDSVVSGLKGTPHWMAPEVIKGTQMTTGWIAADVWSVGCTVVEMVTGKLPYAEYENPMTAMYHIANGQKPPFGDVAHALSNDLENFINSCCDVDPSKRSTAVALLNMPYPARQSRRKAGDSKDNTPQNSPTKASSQHVTRTPGGTMTIRPRDISEDMSSFTPESGMKTKAKGNDLAEEKQDQGSSMVGRMAMYGVKEKTGSSVSGITSTEELQDTVASNTGVVTSTAASTSVNESASSACDDEENGTFSLEKMIAEAERLKADKLARERERENEHAAPSEPSSPTGCDKEHNYDEQSQGDNTDIVEDYQSDGSDGEYGDIDSELDLDEFDEDRDRSRNNSLRAGDPRVDANLNLRGSSVGYTSCESSSLSTSEGNIDSTSARIEYTPKQSTTGPSKRLRPKGPSDRLKEGNYSVSSSNANPMRDSSGTNRLSGSSVATLPAGSSIVDVVSASNSETHISQMQSYENETEIMTDINTTIEAHQEATAAILERVGVSGSTGSGIALNASPNIYRDAETPIMTHGRSFFVDSPTHSQEVYMPKQDASASGLPLGRYTETQGVQRSRNGIYDTVSENPADGTNVSSEAGTFGGSHLGNALLTPHPSAEVTLNSQQRHSSHDGSNGDNNGNGGSSGSAGRPAGPIPGNRLSGCSPGVSIEILERAGSSGAASIRRQALEDLQNDENALHSSGQYKNGTAATSSHRSGYEQADERRCEIRPQQKRQLNRRNSMRSKSANAAGPTPIAAGRLPPMVSTGVVHAHALSSTTGIIGQRPSNPLTGNGMSKGIAHGLGVTSDSTMSFANLSGSGVNMNMPSPTSQRIHSAPSIIRSNDLKINTSTTLPPIQSMTPDLKSKSAKQQHYFSSSTEGLQRQPSDFSKTTNPK